MAGGAAHSIEADVVVVGAGSAGCALAGRLARATKLRVALIEAGGRGRDIWMHVPAGYYRTAYSPRYSWRYRTVPQPMLAGRSLDWPRGRVLGGSSAINGLVYIRGQPEDFRRWRAAGCVGWDWDEVLPVFRRAETSWRGRSEFHGGDGPLHVSPIPMRHRLLDAFVDAAAAVGIPRNEDFNGAGQEGAGYFDLTTKQGFRCSSARAYLSGAPPNLAVHTDIEVSAILMRDGRAVGVVGRRGGAEVEVRAAGAVVLSAGAIGSPQLLWSSGIGDGAALSAAGRPVLRHAPEVGRNLQDHYQVKVVAEVDGRDSYNLIFHSAPRRVAAALRFAVSRSGPLAASGGQVGVFARAMPDAATPDVQFHVSPQSTSDPAAGLDLFPGFTAGVCQLRPTSRGIVTFAAGEGEGPDAPARPVIDPRCLETAHDRDTVVAGLRLALAILGAEPMARHVRRISSPVSAAMTDGEIAAYAASTGNTVYHPAGTCRMGGDAASVVDPRLRVRGVERLYVADASVMPDLVSGNTNAACIMIGERCADFLAQDL